MLYISRHYHIYIHTNLFWNIVMFELHTLPFYEAKSSKLNIHDLQCYSDPNIIMLFIH